MDYTLVNEPHEERRYELQAILEDILGSEEVYFQPPENVSMKYPAIVYKRDYAATQFADNSPYARTQRYAVTCIDKNPDSVIPIKIAALPMSTFSRFFTADNHNHDIYTLYY